MCVMLLDAFNWFFVLVKEINNLISNKMSSWRITNSFINLLNSKVAPMIIETLIKLKAAPFFVFPKQLNKLKATSACLIVYFSNIRGSFIE